MKLSYLMNLVYSVMGCRCYENVCKQYGKFEKINFDYVVVEKAESVAVIAYDGEWKELGTWNTLTEVMEEKLVDDVAILEDTGIRMSSMSLRS